MSEMMLLSKVLACGFFGFFLFRSLEVNFSHEKKKNIIFYMFFALISILNTEPSVICAVFTGVFWAILLRGFFDTIDNSLSSCLNPIWYGFLNIFITFFIDPLTDVLIQNIPLKIVTFASILTTIFLLYDLVAIMRKLN